MIQRSAENAAVPPLLMVDTGVLLFALGRRSRGVHPWQAEVRRLAEAGTEFLIPGILRPHNNERGIFNFLFLVLLWVLVLAVGYRRAAEEATAVHDESASG